MASQEPTTPPESDEVEVDVMAQVLGTDPWARFDVWASHAWEATQSAVNITLSGETLGVDSVDDRVMALFHAAQVAREFAALVNPLAAVARGKATMTVPSDGRAQAILALMLDDEGSD